MSLLVSFCNRTDYSSVSPDLFLAELELPSGAVRPIELPAEVREGATGMTGITAYPRGYIAVLPPRTLVYLAPNFEVEAVKRLDLLLDGHSVAYSGVAYVVSTGSDQILRVPDVGSVDVFWEASNSCSDTVHLNSLMWYRNECFVSAFGPREGERWVTSQNGYVKNITTGQCILRGIYQAHSLLAVGEDIWLCESSRNALVNHHGMRVQTPWNYPRGLAYKDSRLYVGSNLGRARSKSTGQELDPEEVAASKGNCGIGVVELTRRGPQITGFFDLGEYAEEIYDIITIGPARL